MKTAIYIEDSTVQLVITPETEFEKNAIRSFSEQPMVAEVFHGSFYNCMGGWVRQTTNEDQSLILKMSTNSKEV